MGAIRIIGGILQHNESPNPYGEQWVTYDVTPTGQSVSYQEDEEKTGFDVATTDDGKTLIKVGGVELYQLPGMELDKFHAKLTTAKVEVAAALVAKVEEIAGVK